MKLPIAAVLLASAAQAQVSPPPAAGQQAIVDRMRASALAYADRLQDFTCMQTNVRTVDDSGKGHWKPLETQEIEMTYSAHKEHYKVVTINGKPVGLGKGVKPGYFTPGGEFGTSLRLIFTPKFNAQFEWDREEAANGRRTCVFRYRVPLETTGWVMTANLDTVRMAHRGFVEADCDSGAVMRIHMESDPATSRQHGRDIAIGVKTDVRYGPVDIAGKEFLLPLEADEFAVFHTRTTRVQIKFEKYRKYESNSTVTFGDPK
jgi:hypothetical protein